MQINVHYLTQTKGPAGCAKEQVAAAPGACLLDVILQLADRHGCGLRSMLVTDENEPRRSLLYFVGDEHADLSRPMHDGEEITILAPMSGG